MTNRIAIRFHGRLRDFLARAHFDGMDLAIHHEPAVKDVIESLGVPHPEVGLIQMGKKPVGLLEKVQGKISIEVFPTFECPSYAKNPLPVTPIPPRFLCDAHLGALARYLRMLGFDTSYQHRDPGDAWLANTASAENRVMLSRDLGLLKRAIITFGYFPRKTAPKEQMREIVHLFRLKPHFRPFTRCADCNTTLTSIDKTAVIGRIPPRIARSYDAFSHCLACEKVFWMGSHYSRMQEMVRTL